MENDAPTSRRSFLRRLSAAGLASLGGGTLLSACASEAGDRQSDGGATASSEGPCTDLSGLTEAEKETRQTFEYVSSSPKPDELCKGCQFWLAPEGSRPCGGCTVVKGPINPQGWCKVWG